jgi:hypothetical protein
MAEDQLTVVMLKAFIQPQPQDPALARREASGPVHRPIAAGGGLVSLIAADLIAFCRSKTVSKAVHAPPADGSCRKAGRV